MPTFDVVAPDGRKFEVNAPNGASKDDAIAFVKQRYYSDTSPPAARSANGGEQSLLGSLGAGIGYGVGQTALGIQQLVGHGLKKAGADGAADWLINDANSGLANLKAQYQPYEDANPKTAIAGNIGGSVLASIPLTAAVPGAGAVTAAKVIGRGALAGGLSGATAPVQNDSPDNDNFAKEKTLQALAGAGMGAAGGALGKIISPTVSPEVKTLMSQGVTPTVGQIIGGNVAKAEAKMTSLPVVGNLIKNAQVRAIENLNRAAYARTLAPIGGQAPQEVGREGVAAVKGAISDAYNSLLPKLRFQADSQFAADLGNLSDMVANAQTNPAVATQFNKVLQSDVISRMSKSGAMDGQNFKDMESALTQSIKKYRGSPDPANQDIGNALGEVLNSARSALSRSNPQYADDLKGINQAYANFARLRDAAGRTGANTGIFTPEQLQSAVRSADRSVGKGSFATGNALMQDLSEAGKTVLGSKYPDSGTAGRIAGISGPASALTALHVAPLATSLGLGAMALGAMPYTKAGQKLAAGLLTVRPDAAQPIGELVTRGGLLSAPVASGLLSN
ncbi:hypothetical protein [Herbaspirillum seropedicae]|uniref:hypothetical protein n=1 Tax=Herbaspirillum seropedicae TaxID=964 RepID=UPI000847D5D9|nr:hypothetical protein [Herbaspirillum seropedicae]AON55786.1 hypothetical protein Hsc_3520 [Herbaspirillum seropedicae]